MMMNNPGSVIQSTSSFAMMSGVPGQMINIQPSPNHVNAALTQNADQNFEFLFNFTPIEAKDEYDEKLARCYGQVLSIVVANKQSEQSAIEDMIKRINNSSSVPNFAYEEINIGLIVAILLDPQNAPRFYRDLVYLSKDGYTVLVHQVTTLITDRYTKLSDRSRPQLIWLLKELLRNNISGVDNAYFAIFRCIVSGDTAPKNLWLTEALLDIMVEHRIQADQNVPLQSFALFTFLRLIIEHTGVPALRAKEIQYCAELLQTQFAKFIWIGRDLVRILQYVATIPEFHGVWKDLLNAPGLLAPNFQGVSQLLRIRTPRRFTRLRIPADLENKLRFLLHNVRYGQQKRYQDWLAKQYFLTPESMMLRADIIRFVTNSIHPPNEILASEVISRWAFFGWLFTTVTKDQGVTAHCKVALYLDWFTFDERDDVNNMIMDIEPGFLFIIHLYRNYHYLSASNLEFLCRVINEYHPSLKSAMRDGICRAFFYMKEKKVGTIQAIHSVFESPRFDSKLRQMIKETFPDFCAQLRNDFLLAQQGAAPQAMLPTHLQQPQPQHPQHQPQTQPQASVIMSSNDFQMANSETVTSNFSDDEDDAPPVPVKKAEKSNSFNGGGGLKAKAASETSVHRTKSSSQASHFASAFTAPTTLAASNDELINQIITNAASGGGGGNGNASAGHTNEVKVVVVNNHNTHNLNGMIPENVNSNNISGDQYFQDGENEAELVIVDSTIHQRGLAELSNLHEFCEDLIENRLSQQDFLEQVAQLRNETMKQLVLRLSEESDNRKRCDIMDKLVRTLLELDMESEEEEDEIDELLTPLTIVLLHLLRVDLLTKFPKRLQASGSRIPPPHEIDETIKKPLFIMFDFLSGAINKKGKKGKELDSDDDDDEEDEDDDDHDDEDTRSFGSKRTRSRNNEDNSITGSTTHLRHLVAQMGHNCSELGYLMLYYLMVKELSYKGFPMYTKYVKDMNKELATTLLEDIRWCARVDPSMLNYLACQLFSEFPSILVNNAEAIKLLINTSDPVQLQYLASNVISDNCKFFKRDALQNLLERSLKWNYYGQVFLWKLIDVHVDIHADHMLSILPKLNAYEHPEAISNLMRRMVHEGPTANQVKCLMSRESDENDEFAYNIFTLWIKNAKKSEALSDHVSAYVASKLNNKRNKRNMNSSTNIASMLYHIDEMKIVDEDFIKNSVELIQCLVDLKKVASEEQKKTYEDLFGLIPSDHEDEDSNSPESSSSSKSSIKKLKKSSTHSGKKRTTNNSKEASSNNNNNTDDEDTEDDDSEDDAPIKTNKRSIRSKASAGPAKRRQIKESESD